MSDRAPVSPEIDALLQEDRAFPPPSRSAQARMSATRASTKRRRAIRRPSGPSFARELEWSTPWTQGARVEPAACQVVRRRQDQRQRQLPRSASAVSAAQQGRDHLGRRARRPPHADLLRPASRGLPVRQRPEVARRQARRSGRDLPAADPRAGDRDARLRPHRRGALGGVRRLLAPNRCAIASTTRRRGC